MLSNLSQTDFLDDDEQEEKALQKWPERINLVLIFIVVTAVYLFSPVYTSTDSAWSVYITMSVIREQNFSLNEYGERLEVDDYYYVDAINGDYYSYFPVGAPLLGVPVLAVIDQILLKGFSIDLYESIKKDRVPWVVFSEKFMASFFAALTCVVLYKIGRFSLAKTGAFILLCCGAFATSLWSTASRALWQHGPSALMLALALYFLVAARHKPHLVQYASIPLSYAYVIRPTNSLPIIVFTLLILIQYRPYFIKYVLWSLPIGLTFLFSNYLIYEQILSPYYLPDRVGHAGNFWEAFLGNLISPSRGLLIFSPIFLFSAAGVVWKIRQQQFDKLDSCLLVIILLHWFTISSFPIWWAGSSFGPRFFTDLIPYFVYFLIPILVHFRTSPSTWGKRFAIMLFVMAFGISAFVHARGAIAQETFIWNFTPETTYESAEKLWDWSDLQFLRGLRP